MVRCFKRIRSFVQNTFVFQALFPDAAILSAMFTFENHRLVPKLPRLKPRDTGHPTTSVEALLKSAPNGHSHISGQLYLLRPPSKNPVSNPTQTLYLDIPISGHSRNRPQRLSGVTI